MRATNWAMLTYARSGLLGNGCAQGIREILDEFNLHPGLWATPVTPNLIKTERHKGE